MTRAEFASVIAYLELACGKPLVPAALEVYFDLLGDLPADIFSTAARRVALEHPWATFPSAAELRQAASETQRGRIAELSAGEAWSLAWKAIGRIDPECKDSVAREYAKLPPIVIEAIESFGLNAFCYGQEPLGVVRGQFLKIFEALAMLEKRTALMPVSVQRELAARRIEKLPPKIREMLPAVGREIE